MLITYERGEEILKMGEIELIKNEMAMVKDIFLAVLEILPTPSSGEFTEHRFKVT